MEIHININNEAVTLTEGTTLKQLAESRGLPDKGVAIAVNNELKPRQSWADYTLQQGDNVTIVRAFCGG